MALSPAAMITFPAPAARKTSSRGVLAARGDAPGLVHGISAMEACLRYKPWMDKSNGHMFLRPGGLQEAGKDGRGRRTMAENRNADKDPEPVRALREPMGPL